MEDRSTDRLGHRMKTITTELKLFVEKKLELLILNIGGEVARWVAESVQRVVGFVVVSTGILFLLIALAIWLGELIGVPSLGYVAVGVPLLIIGGLLFSLQPKGITRKIKSQFESELLSAIYSGNNRELPSPNEHMEQEEPVART